MTLYYVDFTGVRFDIAENWVKANCPHRLNGLDYIYKKYPNEPGLSFTNKEFTGDGGNTGVSYYEMKKYEKIDIEFPISIKQFFDGAKITLKNGEKLTLLQILLKDDEWWDGCHDFIQYMFPTVTKSEYSSNAPILTKEDAKYIVDNYMDVFQAIRTRFLNYLKSQNMRVMNHNHLRITRFIESQMLILFVDQSVVDYNMDSFLLLCTEYLPMNSSRDEFKTLSYWVKALGSKFE